MLSFDLRSLDAKAAVVEGELAPDDDVWQESDTRPSEPISVTGRISAAGEGRYYWSGRLAGSIELACRRCLEPVHLEVDEEAHMLFAEAEDDDEEADDPDIFRIPPGANTLDIRPAVREQWLLVVPAFALCREDCKGLCANCGADLNAGACACPPATDSRWDALRAARPDSR
jgi:uncharacterized protein